VREDGAGGWGLHRAVDAGKDQTYALALVPYAVLSRVRLPLGPLEKAEVREHAKRLGLSVWDKVDSQDLCFVPDGDYAGYLEHTLGLKRGTEPGAFLDAAGARLGTHRGLVHYTVGQRKGLGLSASEPLYVLALDPEANTVTVGARGQLESPGLVTEAVNWLAPAPPADGTRVLARIRYSHAGAMATLRAVNGGVEAVFDEPQAAVTPGQLAVFYDGDRCLGGAPIACAIGDIGTSGASGAGRGRANGGAPIAGVPAA
jgi:tRNA-specific 2-thiouridylase